MPGVRPKRTAPVDDMHALLLRLDDKPFQHAIARERDQIARIEREHLLVAPEPGPGAEPAIEPERHLRALAATREHIAQAGAQLPQLELFAEELRLAQHQLGSITGEFTADDLLGEIFGRFCIGK